MKCPDCGHEQPDPGYNKIVCENCESKNERQFWITENKMKPARERAEYFFDRFLSDPNQHGINELEEFFLEAELAAKRDQIEKDAKICEGLDWHMYGPGRTLAKEIRSQKVDGEK